MPVSESVARTQIARFSGLGGFRDLPREAIDELVEIAQTEFRDESHLREAVKLLTRTEEWVPRPKSLIEAAAAFPAKDKAFRGQPCSACKGSGLAYTRWLLTRRSDGRGFDRDQLPMPQDLSEDRAQWAMIEPGQDIQESAGWCACAYGQDRKAKREAYEAQQASEFEQARQRLLAKRAGRALSKAEPPADYKAKAAGGDE